MNMQEKSTDKYEAINKEATVGNKPKVLIVSPPLPKKDKNGKYIITASKDVAKKTFKSKRKSCSGCSRKRKRG